MQPVKRASTANKAITRSRRHLMEVFEMAGTEVTLCTWLAYIPFHVRKKVAVLSQYMVVGLQNILEKVDP